jgi:hypothetical protein
MKPLTVHLGDCLNHEISNGAPGLNHENSNSAPGRLCLNHDNGLFTIIYKQKKAERALLTVIALCKF